MVLSREDSMTPIGFIGLGTMGRHMAHNLLRAGHPLTVYARRSDATVEFAEAGAHVADSPADVAARSEIIITIVSADRDVEQLAYGDDGTDGILAAAAPEKLLIDMSTISPHTAQSIAARLATRGMGFLDAPVSGGPSGAKNATLSVMVGASDENFHRASDVLHTLGENVFHIGPVGAGQTVKLVNQLIGAGIMTLIGEGLVLAKAAGVDPHRAADVISASTANSNLFQARARKFVLTDNPEAGFRTDLMRKDINLALELARSASVPVPVAAAAAALYDAACAQGFAERDFSSVTRITQTNADVSLTDGPT